MKKLNIRLWKSLYRHSLNKEPDVGKAMRKQMVAGLQEHGIVGNKIIYLLEDQEHNGRLAIIDGWQFHQACVEADRRDVKPTFCMMPKNVEPEEFVSLMNLRRHETEGIVLARVADRRERVAKAREEGKSLRTIAEEEKVSPITVQRDLEKIENESGASPDAPDGKVTGADGKTYSATSAGPVLCDRCQRVGALADCLRCAELRKNKSKKEDTGERRVPGKPKFNDKPLLDLYGKLLRMLDTRKANMGDGKLPASATTAQATKRDEVRYARIANYKSRHRRLMEVMDIFLDELKDWQKDQ